MNKSPVVIVSCSMQGVTQKVFSPMPEDGYFHPQIYGWPNPGFNDSRGNWFLSDILYYLENQGYQERSMSYDAKSGEILYIFVLKRESHE